MSSLPHHPWDDISADVLRARGSMKWTRFPDTLPGFVAEMDFPLAPPIAQALHAAVDAPLLGYLPEPTKNEMKQATADFVSAQYGWDVPADNVFPTADVLSAYEVTLRAFVPEGSPVIVPTPAYMPFISLTEMLGHPVIQVPMVMVDGRPTMDLERISAELSGGAGLVVLCNPHNPLGVVYSKAELLALASVVDAAGALVFSDEIHAPLTLFGHQHIPYASLNDTTASHTVTSTSASKAWNLPGLKAAQLIVSNNEHLEALKKIEFTVTHGASTLGVIGSTAAYRDGGEWLAQAREYLEGSAREFAQLVEHALPGCGFRQLEGTYIAWLDASALDIGDHPSPAHYFAKTAGVSVTDGALCGEAGEGHIRLILATPRPILREIVSRLAEHWR
jgi:cystathionine beta-lyase